MGEVAGDREAMTGFRSVLREYLDERVRPQVSAAEQARRLPWQIVRQLGELGYLSVGLPGEHGGGLGKVGDFVLIEELARVWGSLAMAVMSSAIIPARLCLESGSTGLWERHGQRAARGEVPAAFALTEMDAGSDAGALVTVAEAAPGGGWRLNGHKAYVTCGADAGFGIVGAKLESPDAREIGLFLVAGNPMPWRVSRRHDMDCHRAVDVVDVALSGVKVDAAARLDSEHKNIWRSLAGERILSTALAVGLAQGALDAGTRYASQRHQFGRPIGSFGEILRMLADSEAEVSAARALGMQAAVDWDAGDHGALGPSRAKLFATEVAVRVTERAQHVHGGYGQMSEFDVGRFARDARMGPVGGGVSEIQARIVARAIGLPVPGRPGGRPGRDRRLPGAGGRKIT